MNSPESQIEAMEALRRIEALAGALRDVSDHPNVAAIINIAQRALLLRGRPVPVPDPRPNPDSFWMRWGI